MTADTITAIKKALEGVTHAPGKWEAEGTAVYCDDATGQRVCDTKGEYLFWSEDQKRNAAVYIAAANPVAVSDLLSEIDRLQRENAALREDRYKLACAITGGEDATGLLDSTPTSEIVEIAQHAHRMHQGDIDRAMAAEAEVNRLRDLVWRAREISRPSIYPTWHKDANAALASTGGEHHADK